MKSDRNGSGMGVGTEQKWGTVTGTGMGTATGISDSPVNGMTESVKRTCQMEDR